MVTEHKLAKGINYYGFLGMGIGCVFGSSWLVLNGTWLKTAGGPINALIAMVLCLIIEIPFALSYLEAVPMLPLAGGEVTFSFMAFGRLASFITGWFDVMICVSICCFETLSLTKLVGYLIPGIDTLYPLYHVGNYSVTLSSIIIGILVISAGCLLGYKGSKVVSNFQKIVVFSNIALVLIAAIILFPYFHLSNFQPVASKPTITGVFSFLTMLPFTLAGWEMVAQGAEEASEGLDRVKVGKAVIWSLIIGDLMYMLTVIVPSAIVPWKTLLNGEIPFAKAASVVMGTPVLGKALVIAAICGVLSVYNTCFFSATRLLYSLGSMELIPKQFAKLHSKYNTPTYNVIYVTLIVVIAPFLGKTVFIPLVDCISFSYIILWFSTLLSVMKLRKTRPDLERPIKMPGGKIVNYLGVVGTVFMLVVLLYPGSPGALQWPLEYLILGSLIILGITLYFISSKARANNTITLSNEL